MIKNMKLAAIAKDGVPIKDDIKNISEIRPNIDEFSLSWLECVVDDVKIGSKEIAKEFGIPLEPASVLGGYYSNYEDAGDVLGITVPLIKFSGGTVDPLSVLIYIARDKIISIHDEEAEKLLRLSGFAEGIMKKLPNSKGAWADRQTILFARIIDEISERNYDTLRLIVEKAQTLEIEMTDEKTMSKDIAEEMSNIKRSIITFLTAVWATHTTVHSLRYGDPEMLSDKDEILSRFDMILADLDRQIQLAEQVLEVLATGVNVIQTNITNRLSTIILWLTVIGTAVLVPNTLATVFAIIPEPASMFSILLNILVISTLASSVIAYLGAKRILGTKRRKK
tara:strand:- start:2147 stop:3160 length:1014 start_codon:yes stop_codon:yes gene_type:complete